MSDYDDDEPGEILTEGDMKNDFEEFLASLKTGFLIEYYHEFLCEPWDDKLHAEMAIEELQSRASNEDAEAFIFILTL